MKNLTLLTAIAVCTYVNVSQARTYTRDEFRIRDPFVLPENGVYYLYESKPWFGGNCVWVRTSTDLDNWSEKQLAMELPPEIKPSAVWAPEVHRYNGAYWMFTTLSFEDDPANPIKPMSKDGFKGKHMQPRGVWVFRSESPLGPFKPVKNGSVTPREWMCLDGTLWVEDGTPWMVFCHEWCQTGDGRMMAVPLSADLSRFTAEPIELFRASQTIHGASNVTDGPFLFHDKTMGLRMIWSNMLEGSGYCVMQCKSESGSVKGPWVLHTPLFTHDGGHGMLFRRFDGQLMLTLHQPNTTPNEKMKLFPINTTWAGFARGDWNPFGPAWQAQWTPQVEKEIDERIEKHRKANATVDGLPAGAEVKVDQVSSKFLVGSQMFNFDQLGSDAMNAAYRVAFTNLFNAATLAFYWKEFEPVEGKPRYTSGPHDLPGFWNAFDFAHSEPEQHVEWRRPAPDRLIDFCRANNLAMHGHAIIYVAWTPNWVWEKASTPDAAAKLYDARVASIALHYGDAIPQWDVVNESLNRTSTKAAPNDDDNWYRAKRPNMVLPKDFTFRAFQVAAENFPASVRLAINDAWTIRNDAYPAFADSLMKRGAKIDVVGYQKHIFIPKDLMAIASGYPALTNSQTWDVPSELRRLGEIAALGKPIHISEITIPSPRGLGNLTDEQADDIQAKVTRAYYRLWFSVPAVDRITYWNLVDGMGIKHERMSSGWFNRDMSPKKVAKTMDELLNREWRTHLTLQADAAGKISFRGFKGSYRLSWNDASGAPNTRTITIE